MNARKSAKTCVSRASHQQYSRQRTSKFVHAWLKDWHATFVVMGLDLSVLFCLCACASSMFETLPIFLLIKVLDTHIQVDVFVQIRKRARRSSVIVLVAAFIGGRGSRGRGVGLVVVRLDLLAGKESRGWRRHRESVYCCHDGSVGGEATSSRSESSSCRDVVAPLILRRLPAAMGDSVPWLQVRLR